MKLMAIDFSRTSPGVATYDSVTGEEKVYNFASGKRSGFERMDFLRKNIASKMKDIDAVIVEDYARGGNGVTETAEHLGAVFMAAWHIREKKDFDIYCINQSSLKKMVTGFGRATGDACSQYGINPLLKSSDAGKIMVQKAVKQKWGQSFSIDDMADAYALLQVFKNFMRLSKDIDLDEMTGTGKDKKPHRVNIKKRNI